MKYLNIQILRAFAAALVVYVHAIKTYEEKIGSVTENLTSDLGDLGVKLFFCISGFIIFNSSSKLPGGLPSATEFFFKRCIRIIPLYWAATLVYAIKLGFQGNAPSMADLLRSLLFIPYLGEQGLMRPVLGQGWTLNFEMLFYVMTAMLLLSRSRFRYHALVAGLAIVSVSGNWLPSAGKSAFFDVSLVTTDLLLFFISGLMVGMYSSSLKTSWVRCPFGKLPPLSVALAAMTIAAVVPMVSGGTQFEAFNFWIELIFCTVAVYAAVIPKNKTVFAKPGKIQMLFINAGDGSYSTYLLHGFLMGTSARLISLLHIDISVYLFSFLMVIFSTIVGYFSYKYLELPAQRALSSILNIKIRLLKTV